MIEDELLQIEEKCKALKDFLKENNQTQIDEQAINITIDEVRISELNSLIKQYKKDLEKQKEKLHLQMRNEDIERINLPKRLSITSTTKIQYKRKENTSDSELFKWLRANNLGRIIKETVHHGSLNKCMKALSKQERNIDGNIIEEIVQATIKISGLNYLKKQIHQGNPTNGYDSMIDEELNKIFGVGNIVDIDEDIVSKKCRGNNTRCLFCGHLIKYDSAVEMEDGFVCKSCDEKNWHCSVCDNPIKDEDIINLEEYIICKSCYDDSWNCSICGKLIVGEPEYELDYEWVCDDCYTKHDSIS